MTGYVKIYGSILGSSIWAEAMPTRIVWITMLAMADEHGKVEASTSGLARFANVTLAECREALKALAAPDTDSRTPDNDGRRVEKVDGGWLILNYLKYREMRSPKQVAEAERKARWRENKEPRDMSPMSPSIRTAVAVDVNEAVESKGLYSRSATTNGNGKAALTLKSIRDLTETATTPGQGTRTFIRRDRVAELGPEVLRAYEAVGGADRVLNATGKDLSFLTREFADALDAAKECV